MVGLNFGRAEMVALCSVTTAGTASHVALKADISWYRSTRA
jgi:hypothetical protein